MKTIKRFARRLARLPGVPQVRHIVERIVAPFLRADVDSLHRDHLDLVEQLLRINHEVVIMKSTLEQVSKHQPAVLNAIASTNGTARMLRRDYDRLAESLHEQLAQVSISSNEIATDLVATLDMKVVSEDSRVRDEMRPHIETIAWLLRRIETVRLEVLTQLQYGAEKTGDLVSEIVNPAALTPADGKIRINMGAGHLPLAGYVNVDIRKLPDIDVVAALDAMPFEEASLAEIFSAHTMEHFPFEELRRRLLPYWWNLLSPGGEFRAVVPDIEATAKEFTEGRMPFETFRSVLYGGQEYDQDFHFVGFSPATLCNLLAEAGFIDAKVVARGRPNGDCLECEVTARRSDT